MNDVTGINPFKNNRGGANREGESSRGESRLATRGSSQEIDERTAQFISFQRRARLMSPRTVRPETAELPIGATPFAERPVTAAAPVLTTSPRTRSPRRPKPASARGARPCELIALQPVRHPQHPHWASKLPPSPRASSPRHWGPAAVLRAVPSYHVHAPVTSRRHLEERPWPPASAGWSTAEVAASVGALGDAFVPIAAVLAANDIDGAALPMLQASQLPLMGIHRFEQIRAVMTHVRELLLSPPEPAREQPEPWGGEAREAEACVLGEEGEEERDAAPQAAEAAEAEGAAAVGRGLQAVEDGRRRQAARQVQARARSGSARRREERREWAARVMQGRWRLLKREAREGGAGRRDMGLMSLISKARAAAEEAADLLFVLCDPH